MRTCILPTELEKHVGWLVGHSNNYKHRQAEFARGRIPREQCVLLHFKGQRLLLRMVQLCSVT